MVAFLWGFVELVPLLSWEMVSASSANCWAVLVTARLATLRVAGYDEAPCLGMGSHRG